MLLLYPGKAIDGHDTRRNVRVQVDFSSRILEKNILHARNEIVKIAYWQSKTPQMDSARRLLIISTLQLRNYIISIYKVLVRGGVIIPHNRRFSRIHANTYRF